MNFTHVNRPMVMTAAYKDTFRFINIEHERCCSKRTHSCDGDGLKATWLECLFRWGRVIVYALRYKEPSQTTWRITLFVKGKKKKRFPNNKDCTCLHKKSGKSRDSRLLERFKCLLKDKDLGCQKKVCNMAYGIF